MLEPLTTTKIDWSNLKQPFPSQPSQESLDELRDKFNLYFEEAREVQPDYVDDDEIVYQEITGFTCGSCHCTFIRILYSLQLRAADEPATLFLECRDCDFITRASEA
jgi:DNA-directed RNA polymerase subunit M/transcription elongation factor TFIIS